MRARDGSFCPVVEHLPILRQAPDSGEDNKDLINNGRTSLLSSAQHISFDSCHQDSERFQQAGRQAGRQALDAEVTSSVKKGAIEQVSSPGMHGFLLQPDVCCT